MNDNILEDLKERTGYILPVRVAGVLEELITKRIKDAIHSELKRVEGY